MNRHRLSCSVVHYPGSVYQPPSGVSALGSTSWRSWLLRNHGILRGSFGSSRRFIACDDRFHDGLKMNPSERAMGLGLRFEELRSRHFCNMFCCTQRLATHRLGILLWQGISLGVLVSSRQLRHRESSGPRIVTSSGNGAKLGNLEPGHVGPISEAEILDMLSPG